MSRSPARRTPRSRTKTSSFASKGSSTASATRSSCARACPRRSASQLLKIADYEIYVRDRSPQAHFAGKTYVLPRQGQQGAPLVTVNTAKVAIDVYRIGDRNLLATVQSRRFPQADRLPRAPRKSRSRTASRSGAARWTSPPSSTRTSSTDFPVLEAVGKLEPGVYVDHRAPWKGKRRRSADSGDDSDEQLATQWMVVSDLGLTAFSGDDGVHAIVAFARHRRAARRRRGQAGGAQQRSAGDQDDRRRRARRFRSGPVARDRAARRRACWSRRSATTTASSTSTQNAFDLTDRGVGGRDAPNGARRLPLSPSAASIARARRCLSTALLRDAKGEAKTGLPLTLVVKRPDGVEYKRATVADQGLGGRAFAVPLLPGAAPGKWTIDAYADPKGDRIGETQFLLEDYIPERLDFAVQAGEAASSSGRAGRVLARREIPLRRARQRARRHRRDPPAGGRGRGARRLPRLCRRPRRRRIHRGREPVRRQGADRRQGPCRSLGRSARGAAAKPLEAKLIVDVAEPGGRTVERASTLPVRAKSVHDRRQEGLRRDR